MVKNLLVVNFVINCVIGLGIYLAQKTGVLLPVFINNYINDFLIIPIVLSICLFVLRLTRGDINFKIPLTLVLLLCIAYSIFFEVILPKTHYRYTADVFDVFLYFLGGLWFFVLQKLKL